MRNIFALLLSFIVPILLSAEPLPKAKTFLKGVVTDKATHESLVGVAIYFPELRTGAITDATGHYLINNLPQ